MKPYKMDTRVTSLKSLVWRDIQFIEVCIKEHGTYVMFLGNSTLCRGCLGKQGSGLDMFYCTLISMAEIYMSFLLNFKL